MSFRTTGLVPLIVALSGLVGQSAARNSASVQSCSLDGSVVHVIDNVARPLAQVRISASPLGDAQGAFAISGGDGHFRLMNLAPGRYYVRGDRAGYVSLALGSTRARGLGVPVVVPSSCAAPPLLLSMIEAGAIDGLVTATTATPHQTCPSQ
jgi:hypothetical protein